MKPQEVNMYREIQKNAEMGIKAIETISDKVMNEQLSRQISRQSIKYSEIRNTAMDELLKVKAEPHHVNHLSDMMLVGGIHYNTMLNTSTGHIAELMIKGSNNGIIGMNKILNKSDEAGEKPVTLAKKMIEFEEKNIETLKKYL